MHFHCTLLRNANYGNHNTHSRPKDKDPWRLSQLTRSLLKCCCNVVRPTLSQVLVGCIKCYEINKWGSTPHLYTYRLNWVRRTWGWWDEWGVTALQTQDSKLSPVGLRPSTLTLGHGGCPQYSIFTIEQGGNILFLWNLNARAGDESAISDLTSRHQDPPSPPPFGIVITYIQTHYLWI